MAFEKKTFDAQPYLFVEKTCDYSDIGQTMGAAFAEIFSFVGANGIKPLNMPMSVYTAMPDGPEMTFRGAVFVSAEDAAKASGDIQSDTMPAGDAMHTMHIGPYSGLGATHKALWDHIKENNLEGRMPVWEVYADDPGDTEESRLRTEIYCALG